jgi:hypothetical protein
MFDEPAAHEWIGLQIVQGVKQRLFAAAFVELPKGISADGVVGLQQGQELASRRHRVPRRSDAQRCDTHPRARPTNACGHPSSSQSRSHASLLGSRLPASISRYSRTVTPISHAARQTRSPSRRRSRSSIPGNAARVGTRRMLSMVTDAHLEAVVRLEPCANHPSQSSRWVSIRKSALRIVPSAADRELEDAAVVLIWHDAVVPASVDDEEVVTRSVRTRCDRDALGRADRRS